MQYTCACDVPPRYIATSAAYNERSAENEKRRLHGELRHVHVPLHAYDCERNIAIFIIQIARHRAASKN
jgi:hypothetical protein